MQLLLVLGLLLSHASAFVVHTSPLNYRNHHVWSLEAWKSAVSRQTKGIEALDELLCQIDDESSNQLLLLFISKNYTDDFVALSQKACAPGRTVLAVVGAGVVGGLQEYDDRFASPAMTMLTGDLKDTQAIPMIVASDDDDDMETSIQEWQTACNQVDCAGARKSHLLFADPFFTETERMIDILGGDSTEVVMGGISCPVVNESTLPTISINGQALPRGSAVGLTLMGNIGIQTVVAQGCRPIGDVLRVTSATNNIVHELDGVSALEQLQRLAVELDAEDRRMIQRGGILCGVEPKGNKEDFLIRQIMGLIPMGEGKGAIVLGIKNIQKGSDFQFHLRDAEAAREDVVFLTQRAKTARLMEGAENVGVPLAALQISCVARGKGLFGSPNVDVTQTSELLGGAYESAPPIAGMFANGEIGPVGISGFGPDSNTASHVHGFTTVIGLLCEFSPAPTTQTSSISETEDAWA